MARCTRGAQHLPGPCSFCLFPEPQASSRQGHVAFTPAWQKARPCWDTFSLQEKIQGADQRRELTWGTTLAPATLGLVQHTSPAIRSAQKQLFSS